MDKNYRKVKGNVIIKVPLKIPLYNPYMRAYAGETDNIIGVYEGEYNNGLAYRIVMDYKGKNDQWSDYFYKLNGTREDFDEMIKELGIEAVYYN